MGRALDCAPRIQSAPRRGPYSERRGPIHSCEARATSPGFHEVRYIDRELTRRAAGTANDTPGPGAYSVRPSMPCGTTFAGPRPKSSRATAIAAAVAVANIRANHGVRERGLTEGRKLAPPQAQSERLSAPLMGRESPGPAYTLPSDFDARPTNMKTFHPPPCRTKKARLLGEGKVSRRARSAGSGATGKQQCRMDMTALSRARREMKDLADRSGAKMLGVPACTTMGRGFLLRIRADGTSVVRLPWGVLYTSEMLTRAMGVASIPTSKLPPRQPSKSDGGGIIATTAGDASPDTVCGDANDPLRPLAPLEST